MRQQSKQFFAAVCDLNTPAGKKVNAESSSYKIFNEQLQSEIKVGARSGAQLLMNKNFFVISDSIVSW